MKPSLVVFDLAGTTIDGSDRVPMFLQKALAASGVDIPFEDANVRMGIPKPDAIEQLLEMYEPDKFSITEERIEKIHRHFVEGMINYYQTSPEVREKEGVSEIFAELHKQGIQIAIDTGFDRSITDAILKRMGWKENHLIDTSVTSDEVLHGRPHPDMIYRAMVLTGITDVKQVAKVGDTASDMQQGKAAGCRWVIGVTTGAYTHEALLKEPHTHLIEQVSELQEIFELNRLSEVV